jgi:hypothetical protein
MEVVVKTYRAFSRVSMYVLSFCVSLFVYGAIHAMDLPGASGTIPEQAEECAEAFDTHGDGCSTAPEIFPYRYGQFIELRDGCTLESLGYKKLESYSDSIDISFFQKVLIADADRYVFGKIIKIDEEVEHATVSFLDVDGSQIRQKDVALDDLFVDPAWNKDPKNFLSFSPNKKRHGGYYHIDSDICFQEFKAAVLDGSSCFFDADYIARVCKQFKDSSAAQMTAVRWLGSNPINNWGCGHLFAQKKAFEPQDEFVCLSDIHGDIDSLIKILEHLQERGYLSNDFSFLKPNFYLIFLGDYVDRGSAGVQVLYTLFRLKIKNPEHVIILRGNHENDTINERYDFADQLRSMGMTMPCERQKVYQAYNLMPVGFYVTYPFEDEQRFGLLCHGGPEIGFNPQPFLKSDADFSILTINRQEEVKKLPDFLRHAIQQDRPDLWENMVAGFLPTPQKPGMLGFLWGDFVENEPDEWVLDEIRGCSLGIDNVRRLCPGMDFVLRGHQHAAWADKLASGHGFYTFAQKPMIGTLLSAAKINLDPGEKEQFSCAYVKLSWHEDRPIFTHTYLDIQGNWQETVTAIPADALAA